jgi:lysophospholipase L1-like esterase
VGSRAVGVVIEEPAAEACGSGEAPILEASLDHGPALVHQVGRSGHRTTLELAAALDPNVPHTLSVSFRAGTLIERWLAPARRLRLGGWRLDAGARLLPSPCRPALAIGWGDSITEGVGVDSLFASWSELGPNRAQATWLPIVAQALQAEYGQLGSGGQSLTAAIPGGLPPLRDTWSIYDGGGQTRLRQGRLDPQPDYVFCNHGTNDRIDPGAAYLRWLEAVRQAAPKADLFVVVPINGFWRREITAVVSGRRAAGDQRTHLVDCPDLQAAAPAGGHPTALAFDGAHPNALGQALFGAAVATRAARALSSNSRDPR